MVLRKFLSWCYKNAENRRELVLRKKTALRNRLLNVAAIDNEIERGFCVLNFYTKHGDFWLNCVTREEPFWYLS